MTLLVTTVTAHNLFQNKFQKRNSENYQLRSDRGEKDQYLISKVSF